MFGKRLVRIFLFLLFSSICYADTRTDQPGLLIGDNNGTNAGRYRSLKFTNGSTTNNADGSISVTTSGGSGITFTDGSNTVTGATQLTVTGGTIGGATPNATLLITGGSPSGWTVSGNDVYTTNTSGNVGIGTTNVIQAALTVMNGNVGIGTWIPINSFSTVGSATIGSLGYAGKTAPTNGLIVTGNVGIGTSSPFTTLQVVQTSNAAAPAILRLSNPGAGTNTGAAIELGYGTASAVTHAAISSFFDAAGNRPLVFYTGAGAAAYTERFRIDGNGNVGIGSTNPQTTLDVNGTLNGIRLSGNVNIGTLAPSNKLSVDINSTVQVDALNLTSSASSAGSEPSMIFASIPGAVSTARISSIPGSAFTNSALKFWVANNSKTLTERMRIDVAGNVGVGSVTPNGQLDVEGTVNTIFDAATNSQSQNVGIGLFNPSTKLDVTGTIRAVGMDVNGTMSVTGLVTMTNIAASSIVANNSNQQLAAATAPNIVNLFSGCSGTQYLGADGACHNSGGSSTAAGGTNAVQYNSGSSTFAGAENVFSFNGTNVGIGTTNGLNLLDVRGTINTVSLDATGTIQTNSLISANLIGSDSSGKLIANNISYLNGNTGTSGTYRSTTFDAQGRETSGTNPTTFSGYAISDSSANLRSVLTDSTGTGVTVFATSPTISNLTGTGNVGLGTTSIAGTGLQVQGTIQTTSLISAPIVTTDSSGKLTSSSWSASANQVYFAASANAQPSGATGFVFVSPNVGINNIAPGAQLDVIGTIKATTLDINGTVTPALFTIGSNVGIGSISPNGVLDVEGTVNSVVFGGISAGSTFKNVGIGSFAPGAMLDVAGAGRFLGTGNSSFNTTSGNVGIGTTLSLNKFDVAGNISIGTTYAGYQSSPTNGLIVQGNVGIGTSLPASQLDVNGTVRGLSGGTCTTLYKCQGGADAGIIQTVACVLCPTSTCIAMNGCF